MRILRLSALLIAIGCASHLADAQEVGAYATLTYDYDTNVAQAYAQTYSDYSTAYYYTAQVIMDLEVQPVNGGSSSTACYLGDAEDNQPAEVSCSPTIPGDNNLNLYTEHDLYVDYYEQDLNPYSCGDYCDEFDDVYGYSLLDVYGDSYGQNVSWFAPGEDTPIPQSEALSAFLDVQFTTNGCPFPNDETSYFYWWGTNHPYTAGFFADVHGSADYDNRTVGEAIYEPNRESCWYPGSPYPIQNFSGNGSWTVGQLNDSDTGQYLGSLSGSYGLDYVGFLDPNVVWYYRNQILQGRYSQCGLSVIQSMYMDGCGGYSQYYGLSHGLAFFIKANEADAERDTADGSKAF